MLVGFIIPLKSKKVTPDWAVTCSLLDQTLHSLALQTCQDFRAVVVGHEKPNLSNIAWQTADYITSPFDVPPIKKAGSYKYYKEFKRILDKYRKIATGLNFLRQENISYVMVLDADDILHKNLVSYVINTKNTNGYIIRKGYQFYSKSKRLVYRQDLDKICGSTTLIHADLVPFPETVNDETISSIPWCHLSHSDMEAYFLQKNKPLKIIPFEGAMYVMQHGQNASDEFRESLRSKLREGLKILLKGKPTSANLLADFGIQDKDKFI